MDAEPTLADTVAAAPTVSDRAETFALVYDQYNRRALQFAGLLYGDPTRAEEAVADAFARIWRRYRRADIEAMWPYLRTALLNGFRSALRRRFLERREEERHVRDARESVNLAGAPDARIHDRAVLLAALQQLPARQRAAVVLRYFDDLSEAAAAAALGCSTGTVKASASRGLARLRVILDDSETEEEAQ